jgi:2-keto-4-pentenoate hydratase/2-oxohepta-3-ene-1,7-dioic acid hydratase in catechol pathway
MKLATVRRDGGTRLFASNASDRLFDVLDAAGDDVRSLSGIEDVGSLYRQGQEVVQAFRAIVDANQSSQVPSFPLGELDLAPPVIWPKAIVCIGRNYAAHIAEGDSPVPEFPLLFSKYANTLVGDGDPVVDHAITKELDYEGELGVVIGRRAQRVAEADAMSYVAGYTVINDISARDLQLGDSQWIRGKSLDTFCPIGPVFVTADDIPDVDALRLQTWVNGELRQDAPISDMLFKIPHLIAFITEGITLEPGDIIATGTPSGVAFGMKPPVYMRPGDRVEITIEGIGTLHSRIVAPS